MDVHVPTVVLMGDSITEFWQDASPNFFADNYLINKGVSGQVSGEMLSRFERDVIALQPQTVIILAGINDIAQNKGYIPIEQTFRNIVTMAENARNNGIEVILSSVLPASDFPWRKGLQPVEKIQKLNELLQKFASENNLTCIDYYHAMVDSDFGLRKEFSDDGVHPNQHGYQVMEPLVKNAIVQANAKL